VNAPADNTALVPVRTSVADLAPSRTLIVALAGWATVGLAASVWSPVVGAWVVVAVLLAIAAVLDALLVHRTPSVHVQRMVPHALAVNEWHDVTVRVSNPSSRTLSVEVIDAPPVSFRTEGLPRTVRIAPGKWVEFPWRLRPTARGEFELAWMEFRVVGPLQLVRQRRRVATPAAVRVYPNFKAVSRFALLALDNRVAEIGIHTRRRRGQGLEFMQLREYREGDPLRQIDWKAVSRRNQLISREYREEQNQQVVFLLDCGRRMRTRDGDLSYFDHVLNSVLLVAYVALRQGDAVGAYTFSGEDRPLPPRKGRGAMNTLLNGLFDIQPTTAPSDFSEAATRIATRVKRRALIILVSNLRDEDARELPAALAPLRRKHLVLLASLREPSIEAAREGSVADLPDALRVAAAHEYMEARQRAHNLVRGRGVQTLDVLPSNLPVALVNRYLDIKRSGAL
jgi:uncharacterized protein (DUF58 family)